MFSTGRRIFLVILTLANESTYVIPLILICRYVLREGAAHSKQCKQMRGRLSHVYTPPHFALNATVSNTMA